MDQAELMLEMLDAARQAGSYVLTFTNMWWSTLSGYSTYYATPSTLGVIVNQQQGISIDNGFYYGYFFDPGEINSNAPRSSVAEYYGYLYLRRSTTRYRWYPLLKNNFAMANHEKLRCRQIDGIPFNSTPHVGVLDIVKNVVLSREIDIGNTCRDPWNNKIVHNGSIW